MFSHQKFIDNVHIVCRKIYKNSFRQENNFSLSINMKIRMKKKNFIRCVTLEKNKFHVIAKRFFLSMNNGIEKSAMK